MSGRKPSDLVQDILDLCDETASYLEDVDLEEFLKSRALQRTVERTLELIGEAATRLGPDRPKIGVPWEPVMRLRIILAHLYDKVNPEMLFETATKGIHDLRRALEKRA